MQFSSFLSYENVSVVEIWSMDFPQHQLLFGFRTFSGMLCSPHFLVYQK
jgi:hypothetical protein